MVFELWMVHEFAAFFLYENDQASTAPTANCDRNLATPPQDLKTAARNESMGALRLAAGLEALPAATQRAAAIASSPLKSAPQSTAAEGDAVNVSSKLAAGGTAMTGRDDVNSVAGSSNDGKCTVVNGNDIVAKSNDEHPPEREDSGNADLDRTDATAPRQTETVEDRPFVGESNGISSLATRMLRVKPSDGKSRVGKAAAVVSSMAGRGRREETRRRAELYEVCPF